MALTLCLITDRRRLADAAGRQGEPSPALLLEQIAGAIAGGVDVVQVREPDLETGDYVRLVRQCATLSAGTPTRIVVNDRLDVALAARADGVHLRESSIGISTARRLTRPGMLVGRSVHSASGAADNRVADYLIAGTLFETRSKSGLSTVLGVEGLRAIVASAGDCPIWAIGGITTANAPAVARAGARGIAAIGAFIPSGAPKDLGRAVEKAAAALRFSLTGP